MDGARISHADSGGSETVNAEPAQDHSGSDGRLRRASKFQTANLSDDLLFGLAMENAEFCTLVLSIVLEKEIVSVEYAEVQKTVLNYAEFKSSRFDVYARDADGILYVIEMQVLNTDSMPKRSRFYQAMLDLSTVKSGRASKYRDLARQYVIFITEFDVFGKGLYKYTFKNQC